MTASTPQQDPPAPAAQDAPPPAAGRPDTSALDVESLARLVLARAIRPRVGEIRRLAEAVLRKKERKRVKKDRKAAEKSAAKAKRKLSTIPARKKTA